MILFYISINRRHGGQTWKVNEMDGCDWMRRSGGSYKGNKGHMEERESPRHQLRGIIEYMRPHVILNSLIL